jgi:hypothetical protein
MLAHPVRELRILLLASQVILPHQRIVVRGTISFCEICGVNARERSKKLQRGCIAADYRCETRVL